MKRWPEIALICLAGAMTVNAIIVPVVRADERRDRPRVEKRTHPRFASPHWVFDARYNHRHYYPSIGYSVGVLPSTRVAVRLRDRHLFFDAGVWFAPAASGFVVVAPPIGAVIPVPPPAYTTVVVNGATYYYANDAYYAPAPDGYAVVAPPLGAATLVEQPVQPPAPQPTPGSVPSASTSPGVWYYCESAKTYYPYINQCPEGWKTVPATPPAATR